MKNLSNNTYKELSFPFSKETFSNIDDVCSQLGIEYYLIGAQARNYHLLINGIQPGRGTQDVDFAVMLPEMKKYDEMIILLIQKGFTKVSEPYRLFHPTSNIVEDFLPFGEIEERGTISFIEREIEISVLGMKEVNAHTISTTYENITIRVSPLEGLVILKLISFNEKPSRKKDLDDISEILKNYFDINIDRFYEENLDLVDEIDKDNFSLIAGARLLGRDIKKIISLSEKLANRMTFIIKSELNEEIGSMSQYFLSKGIYNSHGLTKSIFGHILKGINE